jgi:hypothetical protein
MKERKVITIMKTEKSERRLKKMKNQRAEKKFRPNQNMIKMLTSLIKSQIQLWNQDQGDVEDEEEVVNITVEAIIIAVEEIMEIIIEEEAIMGTTIVLEVISVILIVVAVKPEQTITIEVIMIEKISWNIHKINKNLKIVKISILKDP